MKQVLVMLRATEWIGQGWVEDRVGHLVILVGVNEVEVMAHFVEPALAPAQNALGVDDDDVTVIRRVGKGADAAGIGDLIHHIDVDRVVSPGITGGIPLRAPLEAGDFASGHGIKGRSGLRVLYLGEDQGPVGPAPGQGGIAFADHPTDFVRILVPARGKGPRRAEDALDGKSDAEDIGLNGQKGNRRKNPYCRK